MDIDIIDINDYKELLNKYAALESPDYINNSSPDHAAAMIEVLFKNATGEVRILTDHLNPDVYARPEIKHAAAEFLKKPDNKLLVIMQLREERRVEPSNNNFITSLKEYKDRVKLFVANGTLKELEKHFMVVITPNKKYAFRYEMDLVKHTATCTFNGGESGQYFYNFFEKRIVESANANLLTFPVDAPLETSSPAAETVH